MLGSIALALILVGTYTPWLKPIRSQFGFLNTPIYWITDLPNRFGNWLDERFSSKADLIAENEALKAELLIHKGKLQQMASVYAQNISLQQLRDTTEELEQRVVVAELIGVSPDPTAHKVIINKGRNDGVYINQPLLDADGLMGRVIEVGPYTSQVLLITDSTNALSVQVNRNEVRAVIEGTGELYEMSLRHVEFTADIKENDLLVTSGLDQVFPFGLSVARVTSVENTPGEPFAVIKAVPLAKLNRGRHALLLFQNGGPDQPTGMQLPSNLDAPSTLE